MNPSYFLIAGYTVAWGFVFFYVFSMGVKLKVIKQELETLKKK